MHKSLIYSFLFDLSKNGWFRLDIGVQLVVILLSVAIGFSVYFFLKPKLDEERADLKWFTNGLLKFVFPLFALLSLKLGLAVSVNFFPEKSFYLINIANVLLMAMLSIAAFSYLLRHVFQKALWIGKLENYVSKIIWIFYALRMFGFLSSVNSFLGKISFTFGKDKISLMIALQAIFYIAVIALVAMWLSRLIERSLIGAKIIDTTLRVMLTKVMQTLLIVITILITLPLVGIDPTVLSVFGGALGVGLGLGLQKIASNYVSGFIILLDRSIRIGDLVEIENRQGVISRVTSRYVVLKSIDGTESLVPNDTLITTTVVNQSYTEKLIWIKMAFSVGYESDIDKVLEILVDAAKKSERIMKNPAPHPFLDGFGASAVNVGVGFWLKDPENGQGALKSEINLHVWRAFKENKINIPFNRLDVVHFQPSNRRAGDGNLQGCTDNKLKNPDSIVDLNE